MPQNSWTLLGSRQIADYRVLRFREDRYRFEPTGAEANFAVCETADWAFVIPVTADGQVVFIRQYRHGARQVLLELPGGLMDGEEPPELTAARELREETGYEAERLRLLGRLLPNPGLNNASCYVFLAEGCRVKGKPDLDPLERIEVVLKPLGGVWEMIRTGELCHAQAIAAFALMEAAKGGSRQGH
jgi:ADP-ribose pyrophosphatase